MNEHPNQQDVVHLHDPSRYKHCIVASHGQFFTMDFCDENQNPLPLSTLEKRLQRCVQLGAWAEEQGFDKMPQLGWLTSTNRDTWAEARNELLTVGGDAMKEALFKIESAAFVIDLDQDVSSSS
jgi:Choline/Carnitine o-acyltransferase